MENNENKKKKITELDNNALTASFCPFSITDLDNFSLYCVIQFLSTKDLVHLAQTCSTLKKSIYNMPSLWSDLTFSSKQTMETVIFTLMQPRFLFVRKIQFGSKTDKISFNFDRFFETLQWKSSTDIIVFIENLTSEERKRLGSSISGLTFEQKTLSFPRLTELIFVKCGKLKETCLFSFKKFFPKLEFLTIQKTESFFTLVLGKKTSIYVSLLIDL